MSFRVLNYLNNGLHKAISKDENGNLTSCVYYKRNIEGVLSKKVVEETFNNTYENGSLVKVEITRKHYRRLPEELGLTETEVINYN